MQCRWVAFGLIVVAAISVACSSKPLAQGHQSEQPDEVSPADASQPQRQPEGGSKKTQDEAAISYAKNPDRFAKAQTYEAPFNITNPKTAQEHLNVAVNDDHHKEVEKAIAEYQKALELKPDWALAHFRLAQDYQKEGRTGDAIAHWEQATRYDSQFYSAYDQLAGAYQRQGNLKKAIEAYSALLKYPPAQMPAHYQLGFWYAQLGDRQKAQEHLQGYRALALESNSSEPKTERFQKALRELEKLKH